ncbi:helix-turn-helix domain-containing protein [Alkalibacillus salilacus]|uniref:helix-turn-helix domain-containing protein n=1 Tax=Alkalibacillus salilacus TaxID=284582 RepID=UPI0027D808C1|nr:helix-turn-helix domain-containing protein [Alkalibacillus salilacus]
MFNVSSFIQYHRTNQGLSQRDLTDGICSISYLSKIENDTIEPSQDLFNMLCERLGVSLESFNKMTNHAIEDEIMWLYKLISKKNFNEANSYYQSLKTQLTPFHHERIIHLFKLIELYYFIETKDDRVNHYETDDLLQMEASFVEEKRYYFLKIKGVYYIHLAYPHQAILYLIDAEQVLTRYAMKDPDLYYLIAATYTRLSEPARSNHYCQIAKEQYINVFMYPRITDCYVMFGINYTLLQAFDIAERYFFQVLNSRPMMDSDHVTANVQYNIGFMYCEKQEWKQALNYLHQALSGFHSAFEKLHCVQMIAKAYHHLQENDEAMSYIECGKQLSSQTGDQKILCLLWLLEHQIYDTLHTTQFINEAEQYWLNYLVERGENRTLKQLYFFLSESLVNQNRHSEAITYYNKLMQLGI